MKVGDRIFVYGGESPHSGRLFVNGVVMTVLELRPKDGANWVRCRYEDRNENTVTEHWFLAEQTHGALSKNETAHQQEIKRLKESMSIAMGALDYYASEENWYPVNKIWEHKMVIGSTDTEGENWVGGRRAREALAQLEKVLNEGETK